jgi:hypothetical protein
MLSLLWRLSLEVVAVSIFLVDRIPFVLIFSFGSCSKAIQVVVPAADVTAAP